MKGHPVEPEDNPEQDEPLDVLERYKKAHHVKVRDGGEMKYTESQSKNSETQQCQIDPVFYQKLLHKNNLEEVALSESKLQHFNHLVTLSKEDIVQIQKNAKNSRSIEVFDHLVEEIEKAEICQYYYAESESYTVVDGVTRNMI